MPGLLPDVDPDGLMEYSVVYTDRAVNHMSQSFQQVMRDIHAELTSVYNAASAVVVPGSGTFGMEAVARQFATDTKVLVIRNGWFSYRWSQIFEQGSIPSEEIVLKALPVDDDAAAPSFAPHPIEDVVARIKADKPAVVFAPHVETSAGMILPDGYISQVAAAAHDVGALFALDCIASGAIWVDMQALGVDILCSAPQKGWSGPPCAGLVMLSDAAVARMGETTSTSFSCDLKKWHSIMDAYLNGGHAYHATMPTDALRAFRDVVLETKAFGYSEAKMAQQVLGDRSPHGSQRSRVQECRRRWLWRSWRDRELHHRPEHQERFGLCRPRYADRRRCAAAGRRTRGFLDLPSRSVWSGQAQEHRPHSRHPGIHTDRHRTQLTNRCLAPIR